MAQSLTEPAAAPTLHGAPNPHRWLALAVIAIAQLMVVLDATIVNIALPQAQHELGISDANRQWVVTAYTLTFGGLLLLGGRIADYWGRKRTFVLGIAGFAVASALGGVAQNGETLFAARALQGAFGALLAPASLALLTVLFTDAKERAKAFGIYGAIAAGGASVGLLLGGVLTEYTNWRWCLLVNIPVALVGFAAALPLVPESRAHGDTRYDVPGAALVTAGLVSLVYGFSRASDDGWDATSTLGFIGAALVLLALFVVVEARSANPLLPLRVVWERTRGGAYLASTLTGAGFIGATLFLTFYLQTVLGQKPLEAGVSLLPLSFGIFLAAAIATPSLPKVGAKPLMASGCLISAGGLLLLARIGVHTAYATHMLPALLVLGFGLGFVFVPLANVALTGVAEHDAGAASAVVNASQQVGGSLGTALLNTLATSASAAYLASHVTDPEKMRPVYLESLVHGYRVGFVWGAAMLGAGAIVVLALIRSGRGAADTAPAAVHLG